MSEEQKSTKAVEYTSPEDFIKKSPLFVPIDVDGFEPPETISYDCRSVGCGKGTTWERFHEPDQLGTTVSGRRIYIDYSLKTVSYQCYKCKKSALSVVYRNWSFENRPYRKG